MDRGGEARVISNRDEKESARGEASLYAKQYRQPSIDVLELRTMDRDGEARDISNKDVFKGTRGGAFKYAK